MAKKYEVTNGITVRADGTATVKCGDKVVRVRYKDETNGQHEEKLK